jgi:phosphoribosylformylglycinamidine cyclo-ligase/phosphoribosylamine--glycine ligase/phosphoribosylformylglycinamidine cyclo-ligase
MPLLGGETAEMPGVYLPGEFDLAGTILGVVERQHRLPRRNLCAGDVLVGLASSGLHTNGYSLVRRIFEGVPLERVFPELGGHLIDALLVPHRSYLGLLSPHLGMVKALAHLTGGGFVENLPRILPEGLQAVIDLDSWAVPPLFRLIEARGKVDAQEMYRVFNMGIGMLAVVSQKQACRFQQALGEQSWIIGELTAGKKSVQLIRGENAETDRP